MFSATCQVLLNIIDDGSWDQRGDADTAYTSLTSFEFVFILHLMKEILKIIDMLSQALQRKSQDILNAVHLVKTTKKLLQKLRDDRCDTFIVKVKSFCESHTIDVPYMVALNVERRGRTRHQQDNFTILEHYWINIFIATIDSQLQELNNRFNDHTVKLLVLSSTLDPQNGHMSFNVDDICKLVDEFYPKDFTEYERDDLRIQLQHYKVDIVQHVAFQKLSTIFDLCQWLVKTRKSTIYPLIYRLIRLVLTLLVSTATTECAFSAMNYVKSELETRWRMNILQILLLFTLKREFARQFSTKSIIEGFRDLEERRVQFRQSFDMF